MANSRKSNSELLQHVADTLFPLVAPGKKILLGLSGGMDSVVLLHLLHKLSPQFSWHISALHVHHGISPNADAWADFCAALCAQYEIDLHVERVNISSLREKHGIEAAARQLRHEAFARHECDFVMLAQHVDDQAETLMLQLLRGAGLKGVAAMPVFKSASTFAPALLRPLLDISRSKLQAYAIAQELRWIEDESNEDEYYPRNFLRHQIFPRLEEKFPAYRNTLLRSSRHFAEAAMLLDELACHDASASHTEMKIEARQLQLSALSSLPLPRAKNLFRYFLHLCGAPAPHAAQLDNMLLQMLGASESSNVCVEFAGWQVRLYQHTIYVFPALPRLDLPQTLHWQGENELSWPVLSTNLLFAKSPGQGILLKKLHAAPVTIRLRNGGERLRPHPRAASRTLKNLLQQHHVPPWQRDRLPLVYCGNDLVCVVGVGIAADYQAAPDEDGLLITLQSTTEASFTPNNNAA